MIQTGLEFVCCYLGFTWILRDWDKRLNPSEFCKLYEGHNTRTHLKNSLRAHGGVMQTQKCSHTMCMLRFFVFACLDLKADSCF